ncbi:MAG: C1 family peptidase [Pirellulales bacterium]|nr:C1 family peptidase [Pirellulales bacterium]
MSGPTRALYNAASNNNLLALVRNREIVQGDNNFFSNSLKTYGVTNQKMSERCWLFAGLNVLRPVVIKKYKLDNFEFSENYLAFWDKLEKANCFLEHMIETSDRDLLDREVELLLKRPLPEGGWWDYVVALIEKYGVVPKDAMHESPNSESSFLMFSLLQHKLRGDAIALRKLKQEGKSAEELHAAKEKMLQEIYRMLVFSVGEPPREFTWRYARKKGKPSPPETFTPQRFYREAVGVDLSQYVSLMDDPTHPYRKHYYFRRSRNMIDAADVHFVNVEVGVLKKLAVKSIVDGQPVCFGADALHQQDKQDGIMALGVYDYSALFGVKYPMTKAQQMLTRESTANHAMVFVGVDLRDGKPVKWRVENSWGADKGKSGYWNLYDSWFDQYVYGVIVRKAYVPEEILTLFKEEPAPLPMWHPLYEMFQ